MTSKSYMHKGLKWFYKRSCNTQCATEYGGHSGKQEIRWDYINPWRWSIRSKTSDVDCAYVHERVLAPHPCPTLCNPMDCSLAGSSIHGILQARTLEWVAISFSNAWKWKVKGKLLSRVRPSATPWTAAYQAPPSMGFSRQEYWSGVPLPSPTRHRGNIFTLMWVSWRSSISLIINSP